MQEFEQINGLYSIPEANTVTDEAGAAVTRTAEGSAGTATTIDTNGGEVGGTESGATASLTQALSVAVSASHTNGNGGTCCSDDTSRASDKTEPMDISTIEDVPTTLPGSTLVTKTEEIDTAAGDVSFEIESTSPDIVTDSV